MHGFRHTGGAGDQRKGMLRLLLVLIFPSFGIFDQLAPLRLHIHLDFDQTQLEAAVVRAVDKVQQLLKGTKTRDPCAVVNVTREDFSLTCCIYSYFSRGMCRCAKV